VALQNRVPPPFGDPIAMRARPGYKPGTDPQEGLMGQAWTDFFTALVALFERMPGRVFDISLTNQTATIAATDITNGEITAGLYRWSYFLHVTSADALGGTLQVTFDWTSDVIGLSNSFAVLTADADTKFQSGSLPLVWLDAGDPARYTVTYVPVSGGATYTFYSVLEEVKA